MAKKRIQETSLILLTLLVVVTLSAVAVYKSQPFLRRSVVCKSVRWSPDVSFSVRGLLLEQNTGELPRLAILCQWNENNSYGSRYRLSFLLPLVKGNATGLDPISPQSSHGFAAHMYLEEVPQFLAPINIPIKCTDTNTGKDMGTETLSIRYWPWPYHEPYGDFFND